MKLYRANWLERTIISDNSHKQTEQKVFFFTRGGRERMECRECQTYSWHESWYAAHSWLINKATAEIEECKTRLESARKTCGDIKALADLGSD